MSTTSLPPRTDFSPAPVATDRPRGHVEALTAASGTGAWRPTRRDGRGAALLPSSTTDDGVLITRRIRAVVHGGGRTGAHEDDDRVVRVLAGLGPALDDPRSVAHDIVEAVGELVGSAASTAAG